LNDTKKSDHKSDNKSYDDNDDIKEIKEQKGGDPKYNIPKYREPMNNPMIPNEQRRIYNESRPQYQQYQQGQQGQQGQQYQQYQGQSQSNQPSQILNLQLYNPQQPKAKPTGSAPNPAVFYPNYVPNPYDPIGYANWMQYANYNIQPPIINKNYDITIGGVSGSHIKASMIIENVLPVKNVSQSFTSISERITVYEGIRSVLFNEGDGKNIPIENESQNLLSHVKLMDMNPYNASRFSNNPYRGLPYGFLLYRSCYPVKHDTRNFTSMCSNNSTGVNLRIYRMTEGSYNVNRQNLRTMSEYDEWRDISFYNFVKEQILKKKICPNFPFMYGYSITPNSGINFDELKLIRRTTETNNTNQNVNQSTSVSQNIMNQSIERDRNLTPNTATAMPIRNTGLATAPNIVRSDLTRQLLQNVRDPITGNMIRRQTVNVPTREAQLSAIDRYAGKVLVCLTEASNYNILGWAKKEYRVDGNIRTMINTGYHSKDIWRSVIFQLMAGLYTMQLKGIIINDFRLDRNVFIKDIPIQGTVTNYWKYKIEGIEYYIPNYGYLLMIDSNYRDFDRNYDNTNNNIRKIDGAMIQNTTLTIEESLNKSFETFKNAIDPNVFNQDFVNDDGVKPPEEIIQLLTSIKNETDSRPTMNIAYYIRKFMTHFMNNRVGGPLNDLEINNIKRGSVKQFTKGQIVVYNDSDGVEKFVIHVGTMSNGSARIVTRDGLDPNTSNFIEKEVDPASLTEYSTVEKVKQNFNMTTSNMNEESLLETYTIA